MVWPGSGLILTVCLGAAFRLQGDGGTALLEFHWALWGGQMWQAVSANTGDFVNGERGARVCLPHDTFNASCLFHPGLQDS